MAPSTSESGQDEQGREKKNPNYSANNIFGNGGQGDVFENHRQARKPLHNPASQRSEKDYMKHGKKVNGEAIDSNYSTTQDTADVYSKNHRIRNGGEHRSSNIEIGSSDPSAKEMAFEQTRKGTQFREQHTSNPFKKDSGISADMSAQGKHAVTVTSETGASQSLGQRRIPDRLENTEHRSHLHGGHLNKPETKDPRQEFGFGETKKKIPTPRHQNNDLELLGTQGDSHVAFASGVTKGQKMFARDLDKKNLNGHMAGSRLESTEAKPFNEEMGYAARNPAHTKQIVAEQRSQHAHNASRSGVSGPWFDPVDSNHREWGEPKPQSKELQQSAPPPIYESQAVERAGCKETSPDIFTHSMKPRDPYAPPTVRQGSATAKGMKIQGGNYGAPSTAGMSHRERLKVMREFRNQQ